MRYGTIVHRITSGMTLLGVCATAEWSHANVFGETRRRSLEISRFRERASGVKMIQRVRVKAYSRDGYTLAARTKRTDESCQREAHEARTSGSPARVRTWFQIPPSCWPTSRETRSGFQPPEECNIRSWVFLASPFRLFAVSLAKVTAGILEA